VTAPHNLRRTCAAAQLVSPRTPRLSLTRLISDLRGVFRVNLSQAIQDLFNDIRDVAQLIAPIAAVIGFLGLGDFLDIRPGKSGHWHVNFSQCQNKTNGFEIKLHSKIFPLCYGNEHRE